LKRKSNLVHCKERGNFNEVKMGRLQKLHVAAVWNWGTVTAYGVKLELNE
jgi:hypothetical protein